MNAGTECIAGDIPIDDPEQDRLGRADQAVSFARQILALDAKHGLVVGVLGAWGSGKTSFVNLAKRELERRKIPILDFNPWMFSGAEQLVERFFGELASQMRLRAELGEVGRELQYYGEAFLGWGWVPLVGAWIERLGILAKLVGRLFRRQELGVAQRRARLERALEEVPQPIVVSLDDIDRLSGPEIREVFKLVRLTACLPNIIYIVAFDRVRVEQALNEDGIPGRDYLEKILQVTMDLPSVSSEALTSEFLFELDRAMGSIEGKGPFDAELWTDVFLEIVRPLVRNMRDVRRYVSAARGVVESVGKQVALCDVLGLEAVRIFLPEVFRKLHGCAGPLTITSDEGRGDEAELKRQVEALVQAGDMHRDVVHSLIERLFPAAGRHIGFSGYGAGFKSEWLRARRVAHEHVLGFYLERVCGKGLMAFNDAEEAWSRMGDRAALDGYLRSLSRDRVEDVIGALEAFEREFSQEHVVPGTIVLLNLLPDMPKRQRGMFGLETRLVVSRVTYRLLKASGGPQEVEAAVREILPELKSLSSKLEVIDDVGYREDVGHKLLSEAAAAEFELQWRNEVRSAAVADLVKESDLIWTLIRVKRDSGPSEPELTIDPAPALTNAILTSSRSETLSQSIDSRAVRRFPRLGWGGLMQIFGDEDRLRERVEELKRSGLSIDSDLMALVERYLSGWRPKRDEE